MRKSCLERAYELARSGRLESVTAIKKRLQAEGYSAAQEITGAALIASLGATLRTARGGPVPVIALHRKPLAPAETSAAAREAVTFR